MFYIEQTSELGCGYACIKMMLANIRKDKRYLFIPEKENYLASYKDLIAFAKQEGLKLIGFKANRKEELEKHENFPMLASLVTENGSNHAVLVMSIKRCKVLILDPDIGKQTIPLDKFVQIWDGTGLLIDEDNFDGFNHQIETDIEKKNMLFSILLQALSLAFCVLGVYFINKTVSVVWPILFLSLFIVTQLLQKSLSIKLMKKLDDFYLSNFEIKQNNYYLFFERLEKFKKFSLTSTITLVTNLLVCAFLSFIVILNGLTNILVVAIPICLGLIDKFFIEPAIKQKEKMVSQKETFLSVSKSFDSYKDQLNDIHSESYKIATKIIGKRYIYIFLMICSSILTIAFLKEFSLTQVVFFVVVQLTIFDYFAKALNYSENEQKLYLAKAKLMNVVYFNQNN